MSEQQPLKVIAGAPDRPLIIGDIEIDCYVLSDETRVLSQRGMARGLGFSPIGSGRQLPDFWGSKTLKPFISNDLMLGVNNPVVFNNPSGGGVAYGYPAELLVELCKVVLDARDANVLSRQQQHIAERCYVLIRSLANIAIIALVDEATGYQEIRDRRALANILERVLAKELQPWTKTFPFTFYDGIVKLKQWPSIYAIKRPSIIGRYTNNIVYERLEDGLYNELRSRNPVLPSGYRKNKHHQWFAPEYGNPRLKEHIASTSALMRAAANWRIFYETMLPRAFPKKREQIPLALDD